MVKDERLRACLTCKRRRIKCDQVRPSCGRCVLAVENCVWTKPVDKVKIQFVDTNQAVAARCQSAEKQISLKPATTPKYALHVDLETQAIAFFVRNYVLDSKPNGGPTPGLFGYVMPAVSSSRNTPAAMSISAVALTVFSKWRMDQSLTKRVSGVLGQAIKSLSDDLQRKDSRHSDLTLLTTLLLQYHSAVETLLFSKKSAIVHHLGALALVREFGDPSTWSAIASEFVGILIHLEVGKAIREQRMVHAEVRYWRSIIGSTTVDPIRYLDDLGIQVADLQVRASALQGDVGLDPLSKDIYLLLDDIRKLDECLVLWQGNVSRFWGPFNWTPPSIIFPPIQAFQGSCHVYTSINAARRLNDLRQYRLSLATITLRLIREREKRCPEFRDSNTGHSSVYAIMGRIQWLVDSICASVPFCLGNRSKPGSLSDFNEASWTFPTCHEMSQMYGLYGRPAEPMGLESPSVHYSHALTQGSWLMLSNLALLVAMFLGSKALTPEIPVKDGQLSWICQQYLRNLSLSAIEWTHDNLLVEKVLTGTNLPPVDVLFAEASRCVRGVSRGLQLRDDP